MDLEQSPDSSERTGAPVLWLSCEGQIDVWELFSDNSFLSAIVDRQGLHVSHGFWSMFKIKNPKNVVMSRLLLPKAQGKRMSCANSTVCCWRGRASNPWRQAFPYLGTRIRKDLVVEKGTIQYLQKKYHCTQVDFPIIAAFCYNHLSSYLPRVSMWFQRNGKSDQFLETVYPRQK